jgi:Cu/Ag efflux protein CusF
MRIRGGVMRWSIDLGALALAVALGLGIFAAPRATTAAEQASEVIAGEVTKIDLDRSRVTVRSSDGMPHEFEASAETLKDLKVGDRLEAKRRPEKN